MIWKQNCFEILFGYSNFGNKGLLSYVKIWETSNMDFMEFYISILGNVNVIWMMILVVPIWNIMHDLWFEEMIPLDIGF